MPDRKPPIRIAVNVMRARLTVVGFNLAIITYQLAQIRSLPGGIRLPVIESAIHLGSDISLLIGLSVSVLAMVAFIASSAFDEQGLCTHWSLIAGDLLMYLGLAHSVAGFFAPIVAILNPDTLNSPDQIAELATVRSTVVVAGGCAWFAATYLGPAVSLLRSPFGRLINAGLAAAYLLVLVAVSHVSAQAMRLEAARGGGAAPPSFLLLELAQPLRW